MGHPFQPFGYPHGVALFAPSVMTIYPTWHEKDSPPRVGSILGLWPLSKFDWHSGPPPRRHGLVNGPDG